MERHTVTTPLGDLLVIVHADAFVARAGGHDLAPLVVNRVPLNVRIDGKHDGTVSHLSADRNEWSASRSYYGNQASHAQRTKIVAVAVPAIVAWLDTDEGRAATAAARNEKQASELRQAEAAVAKAREDLATAEAHLAELKAQA